MELNIYLIKIIKVINCGKISFLSNGLITFSISKKGLVEKFIDNLKYLKLDLVGEDMKV